MFVCLGLLIYIIPILGLHDDDITMDSWVMQLVHAVQRTAIFRWMFIVTTKEVRRKIHCEEDLEHATIFCNPQKPRYREGVVEDCCML